MIKVETFHNTVILQSCTYCVYDDVTYEGYVVDAGDASPVLKFIKENGINIKGVFLTHCHYDHIYGINDFVDALPEVKVYCSEETLVGLNDENRHMAYMYQEEDFIAPSNEHYCIINRNSRVVCFGEEIEIIETPGHDIDCLCYVIGNLIFTGDSYTPYAPVIYPWKLSNKEDALKNEQILKDLVKQMNLDVYPGHFQS